MDGNLGRMHGRITSLGIARYAEPAEAMVDSRRLMRRSPSRSSIMGRVGAHGDIETGGTPAVSASASRSESSL